MRRLLTTAVTALRFITCKATQSTNPENYLLVGVGNHIHVYSEWDREAPIVKKPILSPEVHIHGFSDISTDNCIALHAGRVVALLQIQFGAATGRIIDVCVFNHRQFDDWVWAVELVHAPSPLLVVACGHSKTVICDRRDLNRSICIETEEAELTWCAAVFLSENGRTIHAASGTSFGDVLVWTITSVDRISLPPSHNDDMGLRLTHRLTGHAGPVVRIVVASGASRMATASVDRCVRVWIAGRHTCPSCAPQPCFVPLFTHYGHAARVWDVDFVDPSGYSVVSVAEDRTCRVWSGETDGRQLALHRVHAGRNVWRVAVGHMQENRVLLATGGEDGAVKTRLMTMPALLANGTGQSDSAAVVSTAVFQLPDKLPNPRKAGGANDESGRTILLVTSNSLLVTTDFGRILYVTWQDSSSTKSEGSASQLERMIASWTELVRHPCGTAFTPSSLVLLHGVVCAGRTDGDVTLVPTSRSLECGLLAAGNMQRIRGLRDEGGMVMGLFGNEWSDGSSADLFAASPRGNLYHWRLYRGEKGSDHVADSHVRCDFVVTYCAFRFSKTALVTAVCVVRDRGLLVVGDKGGRVHVFCMPGVGQDCPGELGAVAFLRVHDDRVSWAIPAAGDSDVITTGFDGRMTHLRIGHRSEDERAGVSEHGDGMQGDRCCYTLKVVRSERMAERVDTVVRVFMMDGWGTVMAGFRGAFITLWDVRRRVEIFRHNIGNWRRGHDVRILDGDGVVVAFWRCGELHVAWSASGLGRGWDGRVSKGVRCGGCEFHGGRGNCVTWGGADVVLTGGEDTIVRVTRVDFLEGRLHWLQRLGGHISGVNAVYVRDDVGAAVSGGGGDEVFTWVRNDEGSWRQTSSVKVGDIVEDGNVEGNVVMRVTGVSGGWRCGKCATRCAVWAVGRSDGAVVFVHALLEDESRGRWVDGGGMCGRHYDGAVLSLCATDDGQTIVSGGSGGVICVWSGDGESVWQWDGAHGGGVNCVGVRVVDEVTVVVSGGDDETVSVSCVGWTGSWKCEGGQGGHVAAVTGVCFVEGAESMFVTVGADQKVVFWRAVFGKGDGCPPVSAVAVSQVVSAVADIGGVCARVWSDAYSSSKGEEEGDDATLETSKPDVMAVVTGYGLEVIKGPAVL